MSKKILPITPPCSSSALLQEFMQITQPLVHKLNLPSPSENMTQLVSIEGGFTSYLQKTQGIILNYDQVFSRLKENGLDLLPQIIQQEKSHANDFHVFYHVQEKKHLMAQEVYRYLYEKCQNKKLIHFFPLRGNQGLYNDENDDDKKLDAYRKITKIGPVDHLTDHDDLFRGKLLSVNFTFPDVLEVQESSSFYFFHPAGQIVKSKKNATF